MLNSSQFYQKYLLLSMGYFLLGVFLKLQLSIKLYINPCQTNLTETLLKMWGFFFKKKLNFDFTFLKNFAFSMETGFYPDTQKSFPKTTQSSLEPCCALKYYPEIEICVKEQKGEQEAKRKEAQRLEDENFGDHCAGRARTFLWNLMEYPETSKYAQVGCKRK